MKPITITITPAPQPPRNLSIIRISCNDNTLQQTITAEIQDTTTGQYAQVLLWSGKDYLEAGDWTDAQADARLAELATEENVKTWFNVQ